MTGSDANEEKMRQAAELAERAPTPAIVQNVAAGTAGWTDKSLLQSGLFYPPGTSTARARLEHYAKHFAMVEVDATYYSLLPPEVSERWIAWTPDSFRFDIKAHPVLTGHPIDLRRLPGDLREAAADAGFRKGRAYADRLPGELALEIRQRFFGFVQPLARAGRLGCVMLQFPPWFRATRGNVRRLEAIRSAHGEMPFAVEFRHASWLSEDRADRVFDLLGSLDMSYVVVDEPDVPSGGVPPVLRVTNSDLAVVRFHGQNAAGWRRGASVAERFDYLYGPEELATWVAPVRRLAGDAQAVHAVFNNCVRNYAVVNAKGLAVLLGEGGEEA